MVSTVKWPTPLSLKFRIDRPCAKCHTTSTKGHRWCGVCTITLSTVSIHILDWGTGWPTRMMEGPKEMNIWKRSKCSGLYKPCCVYQIARFYQRKWRSKSAGELTWFGFRIYNEHPGQPRSAMISVCLLLEQDSVSRKNSFPPDCLPQNSQKHWTKRSPPKAQSFIFAHRSLPASVREQKHDSPEAVEPPEVGGSSQCTRFYKDL